jgi:hypothetical protein
MKKGMQSQRKMLLMPVLKECALELLTMDVLTSLLKIQVGLTALSVKSNPMHTIPSPIVTHLLSVVENEE